MLRMVKFLREVFLLDIGKQNWDKCQPQWTGLGAERELLVDIVVVVEAQSPLLEIVDTLRAGGGLPDLLQRGHQESDQNGDDSDNDKQLDKRERSAPPRVVKIHG